MEARAPLIEWDICYHRLRNEFLTGKANILDHTEVWIVQIDKKLKSF